MRNRMHIRRISLLVLLAFVMSLGAPIVEAQTAAATTAAPSTGNVVTNAVNTAKHALSDLWFAWAKRPVPPGTPANYKPSIKEAFSFFTTKGATPQQAEILANNAQASGMTVEVAMTPAEAPQSLISRIFGTKKTPGVAATEPVAGTSGNLLTRIKEGFSNVFSGAKKTADKVVLGGRRAADTVVTGAQTAAFTIGDKLDFNRYYELPLTDNSAVKFRGQWESTVKFTDGKWVVGSSSTSSSWPGGTIKSGDAVARIEDIAVGLNEGKITQSGAGNFASKIKDAATSLRDKIFGSKTRTLSGDQVNELGKLEIQGHLMEQSRAIVDAQKAIEGRITDLTAKAQRLQKPVPQEEITALKKGYDTLEAQKKEISKRINQSTETPAKSMMKDAAVWALYSVGITAGINVIKQVVSGDKIDLKSAFSFVAQPSFWGGTAGGFVGSMLFQTLASSFLPPGMGIFFKVLPGFLGAALGYEVGGGLFGGGPTNWIATIGQTVASAGGYALAYSLLGGAAAPGIALIGASIAAGAVANFLLSKLFNKAGQPESEVANIEQPLVPVADPVEQVAPTAAPVQTLESATPAASDTSANLNAAAAAQEMKSAYNEYINYLKERKVADARGAYDRYVKAKEALDKSRQASAQ